jgi:hypothetical protein
VRRQTVTTKIRMIGLILMLLLCLGCNRHRSLTLPADLAGVWTSDDPRYHDRFFELWPTFVIVVTGPGNPASVQWIRKVEAKPQGDSSAFTVYSTDYSQHTDYQMVLQFNPANGGEIRFGNEPQIWKRRRETTK